MLKIRSRLERSERIAPKSFAMAAYSLGALQLMAIKEINVTTTVFNFKKTLLINPPVDLVYLGDAVCSANKT